MSSTMLAMMGGNGAAPTGGAAWLPMVGYMAIFFALFYFLMIRPQARREQERKKMLEQIKAGDRILFCGGMIGLVTNVKNQTLTVKIADNVKVEVARGAVIRVLEADEAPGDLEMNKTA